MQKTENYQLNQWDKTDRIQMEDFNADNAKIEAALAAEAGSRASLEQAVAALAAQMTPQTLVDATCTISNGGWSVDISSIDWSQWRTVYIIVEPKTNSGTSCRLQTNDNATIISTLSGSCTLMLIPLMRPDAQFSGLCVNGGSFFSIGSTFKTITSLYLMGTTGDYQILAGSKLKVIGAK